MSRVYNTIGSLTTIKDHLVKNNIYDFKSLKEVIDFKNSYVSKRNEILAQSKDLILKEKGQLTAELNELDAVVSRHKTEVERKLNLEIEDLVEEKLKLASGSSTQIFAKLWDKFRQTELQREIDRKRRNFNEIVNSSLAGFAAELQIKRNRQRFIEANFEAAVHERAQMSLFELDRKKIAINAIGSFIPGALGEQQVVKTLEVLPDNCHLINDFSISFSKAIYYSQGNDYIKTIQIDHILITPAGVFIIETKNWSEKSINNLDLRSPVQQIKRSSFALFVLMHDSGLSLNLHHWGDKKIPIKNLIVMIHSKPNAEFQFIKILTLNELPGYVKYFKPIFSDTEVQYITDHLNYLNGKEMV
ncbi:MAG: NERD domain-containing protein [Saprospiraceae bacterium]|nr:NERD domain-containing protein [Saprospiraceae bacterium]